MHGQQDPAGYLGVHTQDNEDSNPNILRQQEKSQGSEENNSSHLRQQESKRKAARTTIQTI
jgi:hypothetical protein